MRKILLSAILSVFVIFISEKIAAQGITITSAPDVVCHQATINVFYSLTGSFNAGNTFKLEYRQQGSVSVLPLNSQTDNGAQVTGTFPATTQTDYEIRITSSNPVVSSVWKPIVVRPQATATISGTAIVCQGGTAPTITFNNPMVLPVTVTYNINSGASQTININANATNTVIQSTATSGTFTYNLISVAYQTAPACTNTITGSASITVRQTPTITISGTTTVSLGGTAPQITFTNPTNLPLTVTYNVNGGASQTIIINANATNTVSQSTAVVGTFTYNLVSASYQTAPSCSKAISGTATITVQSGPTHTYHNLSASAFRQDWSDTTLIRVADDWSGVPSIVGYLGNDGATSASITDAQLAVGDKYSDTLDVVPGIKTPTSNTAGGVGEMEIDNPTIALQGSGTADAPNIILYINSTGVSGIRVKYKLRDVDSSADVSKQPVALQYRLGNTGDFINVPEAYVPLAADTLANLGSKVTDVSVLLPSTCNNQSQLQLRIITGNAQGNDQWIGIDDIAVEKDASTNVSNFMLPAGSVRILENPVTSEKLHVQFNEALKGEASMRLLDQSGRVLSLRQLNRVTIGQVEQLSMSGLSSGVYILQINAKEGRFTTKIIR